MANLPQMVGTDFDTSKRSQSHDGNIKISDDNSPTESALPTIDAKATFTPVENSGQALASLSKDVGDIAQAQVDAAQKTWLLNAASKHELDAQTMLSNAQRNAAPGQSITPIMQDALTKLTNENSSNIESPLLQSNYQNQAEVANRSILSAAQAFDFTQRDKQIEYNFKQGVNNNQNVLALQTNSRDIDSKLGEMMAGIHKNIDSLPLTQSQKQDMLEHARKGLVEAATTSMARLDPNGFKVQNSGTPSEAILNFIQLAEGGAVAKLDNDGHLVKYGINQGKNPDVDVANLTQQQARDIIQTRYVSKVVTQDMSPQMALVAGDSAVNMGVEQTKELLQKADGDPQKMLELRAERYQALAQKDPALYGGSLNGWLARLGDIQAQLPNMTPRTMPDENGNPTQQIGGSLAMRLATFDERQGALRYADQTLHSNIALEQHYQAMQAKQTLAAQDKTMNDYLTAAMQGKLTSNDIMNDKVLDFHQREAVLGAIKSETNNQEKTDPKTFIDLFQRIHAAPDAPDRIINSQDLVPYVGKGISFTDYQRLEGQVSGRTDKDFEKLKTQSDKTVRSWFLGKADMYQMPDPKGEELYGHALALMMDAETQARKNGTFSSDMLDPASKNWLGNVAKPLVRTNQQIMSDEMNKSSATPIPAMNDRVVGKVYQSPNGPLLWAGSGWKKQTLPEVPISKE